MSDPVVRLNAALEGRYAIEREAVACRGANEMKSFGITSVLLLTLVLAIPSAGEAQVLQPSKLCSDQPDTAIATFEDANLAVRVRSALSLGAQDDLTCRLVSGLTRLDAEQAGIESLVGIQNLTSLTELRLGNNSITDIGALSGLTSLEDLCLFINSITDIGALRGLTSLTILSLRNNSISDISALSGLTSLTRLYLQVNSITDIGALSGLTSLTRLYLQVNSITDIGALSGLTSLTRLNLNNTSIADIGALRGLTGLTELRLGINSITDISPLSGLTSLTDLRLQANSIGDISALSGLTSLEVLFIGNNLPDTGDFPALAISDISALSGLTSLENLRLQGTSIIDISVLSGLTGLERLRLDRNSITDVSPLSGLTGLERLRLGSNAITDIGALSGLTGLELLRLDRNSITDVSPLSGLTGLTELVLWANSITDIGALSGLTSLTSLDLAGNSITDISVLTGRTSLTDLGLDDNLITDISPLSELTSLKYLSLGGNSINDISALSGLTSLELLRLDDNSITDISALTALMSLTYLSLSRNPDLANIRPLLDNTRLGADHTVFLGGTNVSCTDVAALMGVYVVGVEPCSAALTTSGLAQGTASVSGTTERIQERSYQFEEAGLPMEYQLYVPTTYDAATPSPLLVLLHGRGVTPGQIIRYQGFTDLAEERGYIVVAPMGYNLLVGYGAYGSGGTHELSERDVMNVLELTLEAFNVDSNRIYLAGHSMGGGGTFHLAIKYPDIWAALGPVAPWTNTSPDALSAITHIPVIVVQGDSDTSVSVPGTRTWVARMAELGMTYRYIEIPGGDHFSIIRSDRDNVQAIFDFFDQARRN